MTEAPDAAQEPRVERNDELGRYEIFSGGALAGFTEFVEKDPNRMIFPHTEVDDAFRGMGLAPILAKAALEDAASRTKTIVPVCPYIVRYLERHDIPGAVVEFPDDVLAENGSA